MLNDLLIFENSLWGGAKLLVLLGLGVYLVFAFVVVRQVKLMTNTLEVGFETPIKLFSYFHLLFAVATFFAALIIL